ncbi:MAG TPA: isoleucine--tRNA ligase [Candidatus Saccharimonadales bacterium]|nr:isoleucine--tRNA ligase [Candidatus Saccharimonadales bacterium]
MKFKQGTRRKPVEYEKELIHYWKEHETFKRSIERRSASDSYVFYDGPPFITGVPHVGTLLATTAKDVVPRYWTMKGKHVERVWGWDCHGLPAEVFTEKKLGVKDRRDIGTKISLEDYIRTCRDNMIQTGSLWEDTIDRIGRWVDFDGAYRTMDKNYMESIWWAFKELYERGKIYEGEKVLLYCVRDATPLSKAEVTMDAGSYREVNDPSVYVKFKLRDSDAFILAWTTTPWTLPANVAVAVNKAFDYVEVEVAGERLILAQDLLPKVLTDEKHQPLPYKIIRSFKGKELVGKRMEPLFEDHGAKAHTIYHEDYVSLEEGTGIVHSAPAYGEEDFIMAQEEGMPIISVIDENGFYKSGRWKGQYVWDADKEIAKELLKEGIVWKIEYIQHSYPHCYRCNTRLMYRAHPSWFMDIASQRNEMLEENGNISWFPEHLKQGRFAKTIEAAPDWNLSRDRFWATAMPVWKGTDAQGKDHIKVVGSYRELKELSGVELDDYHRPWIDGVIFTIDGIEYRRIDKVMDCWFESGSMPFAQFHYPFDNVQKFEQNYPGDFVVEYIGQVRAWFYYMHAVNVALFGHNAFKHVIVTGNLAGNDGRKMSKSYGNYTDPNELMDLYSADALRFLLMSSPVMNGEDYSLQDKEVSDVQRKLAMIWNMYDFFTLYADVDNWEWDGEVKDPGDRLSNPLDQWIVSRLHQLIDAVDTNMRRYDIPGALAPVLPFIDDASNWYVRRSRRRFWKTEDDDDKQTAYQTLHYVLVQLAHVLAPFTPFLAEELYKKLTGDESVHLRDWPEVGRINDLVLQQMADIRADIEQGLSQRAAAGIKVRQPLNRVQLHMRSIPATHDILQHYQQIVKDELNVKEVIVTEAPPESAKPYLVRLDTTITPKLRREGKAREVIRHIQSARKKFKLQVDNRIRLSLSTTDDELRRAISEHSATIISETLANELVMDQTFADSLDCEVDGLPLTISLQVHREENSRP